MNRKDLETIQAVQSDTLREIAFDFYATDAEDAVQLDPDEFTVKFNMLKPDNNFVMTTFTDGIIKLSDNMTAVTGTGYYCIMLMDGDDVIYSGNGKIIINDHVIGTDNIDSVSEADGLVFPDDFYTRDTPIAEIDDSGTSDSSTWSSEKIAEEIAAGSGADLIDDLTTSTEKTWSSSKISSQISAKASINDSSITHTETWSSDKIATELNGKPDIDDSAQNYTDTWSSQKINDEIDEAGRIDDVRTSDETTWSSEKIANEISSITPGGATYSTTEHAIGTWIDGSTVYERTYRYTGNVPANPFQTNLDFTGKQVIDFIPHYAQYTYDGGTKTGIIVGSELLVSNSEMLQVQYNPEPPTLRVYSWLGNATESYDIAFTLRYTKTGGGN